MAPKVVEIRNIVEGKVERIELSRESAAHLISAMYAGFAPMKLTGPMMESATDFGSMRGLRRRFCLR